MYETELDWVYSFGRPQSGLMVNLDSGVSKVSSGI